MQMHDTLEQRTAGDTRPMELDPRPSLTLAALASALDAVDTGLLVCDARARVMLANDEARRVLARRAVLGIDAEGSLETPGSAAILALRRAVHAAVDARRHQMLPLRAGDRLLMVSVQPVRGCMDLALVQMARQRLCPDLALQEYARLCGLTPAELEVLVALLDGVRAGDVAQARGVEVSTVRTQIGALRTKLGAPRIGDLVRRIATLPPMTGALRQPPHD